MSWRTCVLIAASCVCLMDIHNVEGKKGVGPGEQDWGYVKVRPGANMFWWLYYTTANVTHYRERPLIIWLQGGPGMASSGYGNFLEIGPLNMDMEPREHTWVKDYNILFLDNPIGVGFSYISSNRTKLVQNQADIGSDLVKFLIKYLRKFTEFQTIPSYIFGESYGGKMAVEFALQIHNEVEKGKLKMNLNGVGLGDAYISPIDYINHYGPFALNLGLTDRHGYKAITELAEKIKCAILHRDYEEASELEARITDTVFEATQGIDIYNIMLTSNSTSMPRFLSYQEPCNNFMNGPIKQMLNLSNEIEWSFINDDIYNSLLGDLIRPVTDTIEELLNKTNIKVIVYNGVFDFIVNTPGTAKWLDNLSWSREKEWRNASQEALEINMVNEGYVKKVGNLVFYTVLRAGHSIPIDNPIAMDEILRRELLEDNELLPST